LRTDLALLPVLVLVLTSFACLGSRSGASTRDAGALRPLSQTMAIQAAFNDRTFFLHVRWVSDAVTPALSVALAGRDPPTAVRSFATAGCFLGCHDFSSDMPNWLPQDGDRSMYLLPGFGGPADVWLWQAQAGNPAGQAIDSFLGTVGLVADPEGGVDGITAMGSLGDRTWDVVYARSLAAENASSVTLTPGGRYDFGFALHPDNVQGRFHYVSLPVAIGLGDASADLAAVALAPAAVPDFSDTAAFPPLAIDLFLPGITSFEFLVGAVVDRNGQLRHDDYRHGGAHAVATGALACRDCHRVVSDAEVSPVQNAGALERLVPRRGGLFGPAGLEVSR
jgi:hypothetical protein